MELNLKQGVTAQAPTVTMSHRTSWQLEQSIPLCQVAFFPVVFDHDRFIVERREDAFGVPSFNDPRAKRALVDAEKSAPSSQSTRLPIVQKDAVITPIVGLRNNIVPFGVHRPLVLDALLTRTARVVSVVIDSVYREIPVRSVAHVFQKVFKHHPALTDGDTPTAVSIVRPVILIRCPPYHVTPRGIRELSGATMGSSCAAATSSIKQVASSSDSKSPADTTAQPVNAPASLFGTRTKKTNNFQIAKNLAGYILNSVKVLDFKVTYCGKVKTRHRFSYSESVFRGRRLFALSAAPLRIL